MDNETERKIVTQADYSLFDIVELYDGCIVQFSDKVRNTLGDGFTEFRKLFGDMRGRTDSWLETHPKIVQRANGIAKQNFRVTVKDLESSMSTIRKLYIETRRGGGNTKKKIQGVVKKLGCDFAPYTPKKVKPVTKPYKERTQDLLNHSLKK